MSPSTNPPPPPPCSDPSHATSVDAGGGSGWGFEGNKRSRVRRVHTSRRPLMLKIGENIHIISPRVKAALAERDGGFFVDLARRQKAAGADALDLNIGPQKKAGPEVMDWLVDSVQEAGPGMTLSFDTTNL